MVYNKYLEDLGLKQTEYATNFTGDDDPREEDWKKERETYGFDQRETWNLDHQFVEWLYSHLKMYDEVNCVDTSYHKFQIGEKELTQQECMDYILAACETYLIKSKDALPFDEEQKYVEEMQEAIKIWAVILPAMWW